jgi:hypothetical protein
MNEAELAALDLTLDDLKDPSLMGMLADLEHEVNGSGAVAKATTTITSVNSDAGSQAAQPHPSVQQHVTADAPKVQAQVRIRDSAYVTFV